MIKSFPNLLLNIYLQPLYLAIADDFEQHVLPLVLDLPVGAHLGLLQVAHFLNVLEVLDVLRSVLVL